MHESLWRHSVHEDCARAGLSIRYPAGFPALALALESSSKETVQEAFGTIEIRAVLKSTLVAMSLVILLYLVSSFS